MRASRRMWAPILLGVVVLIAWQWASSTVPASILPPPLAVLDRVVDEFLHGDLFTRTLVTVKEAALGCLVAAVIGLPMGTLVALNRLADDTLGPYLAASQAVPAVAIAPLLVVWVGYGLAPIVILCAILVFFPIVLTTRLGLMNTDRDVIEAARLDGASNSQLLFRVRYPLAAAALLTGIRNGFTLSITGAVVGELVMGGQGLGMTLASYSATTDTTGMFAALIVLCLLAIAMYLALLGLQAALDPLAKD